MNVNTIASKFRNGVSGETSGAIIRGALSVRPQTSGRGAASCAALPNGLHPFWLFVVMESAALLIEPEQSPIVGVEISQSLNRRMAAVRRAVVGPLERAPWSLTSSVRAFAFAVPIAMLGGLIGLGGAEFRLPVLAGSLGYSARQAVPLNLAISAITIVASLAIRSRTLPFAQVAPFAPAIIALITGAMIAAFFGTGLFSRLSDVHLERAILLLLTGIGVALIAEGFLPGEGPALLPVTPLAWVVAGVLFGLGIGLVSSLLGVAGGEIIIPTLVFAYGVDIKTAGTASLLVSLPVVVVGIVRHASRGAYARAELTRTVAPMGLGSVVGAVLGGSLVGAVAASTLKIGLGIILLFSSWQTFRRR